MSNIPKIALIGSRGVPAKYGGNEVIAEEIAIRLLHMGFEVYVTCESSRFYTDKYQGITRIHTPSIQGKTLTIPFLNDALSTLYILLKCPSIDLIYYVSPPGAVITALLPRLLRKKVLINTDGIEWKRLGIRKRFSSIGWKFAFTIVGWGLKVEEWMDTMLAHVVIADSRAIKSHLERSYKSKNVVYIPYGARYLIKSVMIVQFQQ